MPIVMVLRPLPFCRKIGRMTTVPSSVPMAIMIMVTLSVNVRFVKGCRFSSSRPMRVRSDLSDDEEGQCGEADHEADQRDRRAVQHAAEGGDRVDQSAEREGGEDDGEDVHR